MFRQDEETEKRGLVVVAFHVGDVSIEGMGPLGLAKAGAYLGQAIPVKVAAFHHCFVDQQGLSFLPVVKHVLENAQTHRTARSNVHFGKSTTMYMPSTFEMPIPTVLYYPMIDNILHDPFSSSPLLL